MGCAQDEDPKNLWTDSTGVEWCVVDEEGDYSMLVSRRVHRLPERRWSVDADNANHATNEFIEWPYTTEDIESGRISGACEYLV